MEEAGCDVLDNCGFTTLWSTTNLEATELLDCPTCGRQVHHVRNKLLVQQSLLVRVNQLTSDVRKTNAHFVLEPRINPFELQGIVIHRGTANSGHYYT